MTGAGIRRLLHALTAGSLILVPLTSWTLFRWFIITVTAIAFAVDRLRLRNATLQQTLDRYLPVFRARERNRTSGAVWLWAGYALASWIPPVPTAPAAGILVAALADPAASLAGTRVGRGQEKTWTGSSAALLVAVLVLSALGLPALTVVCGALAGAALERWPGPIDDNLLIAPGVAGVVGVTGWLVA